MANEVTEQSSFMFYASPEGDALIRVYVEDDDTWVTQAAMSEIFGTTKQNVGKHLKNIFNDGELSENSVVNKKFTTAADGKKYETNFYNLDAIVSVGYRVNSHKATQFRIWATGILKEYMLKGFAMDDDRLKQGKQLFGKDYFDELLERIRDIRASERRFYQKITDIYTQCSYDYDKSSPITQQFFAQAQNKLEYAVTKMTAAEIIDARANHKLPNMGLTTWKNQKAQGKVLKGDITVAKNYLTEDEISDLNRLVNMFLDFAENLAKKGKKMSMQDWITRLDSFLEFNEYEILADYGSIQKATADANAEIQYLKFKPIQEANYMSDFDKAIQTIKATGELPKVERDRLKKGISGFDKKLKQALDYNPKD
jgi:hypothetical protein